MGLPAGLPDGSWIVQRYGAANPALATDLSKMYDTIALLVLDAISKTVSIPFPETDVPTETMYVSGKVDFVLPKFYPVTAITKATVNGVQALRVGTELQLQTGVADVAIADDGETIRFGWWGGDPRGWRGVRLFVDYTAGMDVLPPDLLEVFTEWCWLIGQEKGRAGMKAERVDLVQTTYTKDLPHWAKRTLDGYRRVQVYV